ncbi:hypothetical protein N2152v2_005551 [Parachlorella kessleri]
MASDDDSEEFNDLDALSRELEELKTALGATAAAGVPSTGAPAAAAQNQGGTAEEAGEQQPRTGSSFKVEAIQTALAANRALQRRLARLLAMVERASNKNADLVTQARAVELKKAAAPAGAPGGGGPSAPAVAVSPSSGFWQVNGQPPPPHPHALQLEPVFQRLPLAFCLVPWSEEERKKLRAGVLQLVQDVAVIAVSLVLLTLGVGFRGVGLQELQAGGHGCRPARHCCCGFGYWRLGGWLGGEEVKVNLALEQFQRVTEAGGTYTMDDYQEQSEAIAQLTEDSPEVLTVAQQLTPEQWATVVARSGLQPQRNAAEAQLQWRNAARPGLRMGSFSEEEDRLLLEAVERLGDREWDAVSEALGGCRPPLSCLARYRQLARERTAEDREGDLSEGAYERLGRLVEEHKGSWKLIGPAFGRPGWSGKQLMHVWRRRKQRLAGAAAAQAQVQAQGQGEGDLGPTPAVVVPRTGKWSAAEDEMLIRAMAVHQRQWSKVALLVPGRSDVQCRERFMNVLNPEVRNGEAWTGEEDGTLERLVPLNKRPNGKVMWSKVAAHLPGRTDRACADRWEVLHPKAATRVQRRRQQTPSAPRRELNTVRGRRGGGSQPPWSTAKGAGEEEGSGGEPVQGVERGSESPRGNQQYWEEDSSSDASYQHSGGSSSSAHSRGSAGSSEWGGEGRQLPRVATEASMAATRTRRSAAQRSRHSRGRQPPAPTQAAMPCSRADAVGRRVGVWWIDDESTGEGRLYDGKIEAFDAATGQHVVLYRTGPEEHRLLEETLAWDSGEVTGPGATWPEDGLQPSGQQGQPPEQVQPLKQGVLEESSGQQQPQRQEGRQQHEGRDKEEKEEEQEPAGHSTEPAPAPSPNQEAAAEGRVAAASSRRKRKQGSPAAA